jgi:hypothetical protein
VEIGAAEHLDQLIERRRRAVAVDPGGHMLTRLVELALDLPQALAERVAIHPSGFRLNSALYLGGKLLTVSPGAADDPSYRDHCHNVTARSQNCAQSHSEMSLCKWNTAGGRYPACVTSSIATEEG